MAEKQETICEAIEALLQKHSNAVFLVNGTSFYGELHKFSCADREKFLMIGDYMATGAVDREILSEKYIEMRTKEFNDPWGEIYTKQEYERDCVSKLRSLAKREKAEVILVQFDCLVSQIWQLTMQAYVEQIGISDHVTRLVFCHDFSVGENNRIFILGSYDAYCQLMCQHKKIDVSRFMITHAAVDCYLAIHTTENIFKEYILKKSATFDTPYSAFIAFSKDFPQWGLEDRDFMRIAYNTMCASGRYKDVAKRWMRMLK